MAKRGIRKKGKKRDPNFQKKGVRQNYVLPALGKNNERFYEYYKKQGIIKEDEWEAFVSALQQELPISFRVRGSAKEAEALIALMKERYLTPMTDCGDSEVHVPEPLPWYPHAYQTSMSRTAVRSRPSIKAFHNFLVTEAEIGNVSRQEAVSMIPPLLLDVQPHHNVLDVCAAPGSKTVQIIEKMHENTNLPKGMVVANDADNTRCYLLVRQALKRMPTSNCIVINEDAAYMPSLSSDKDSSQRMLFDRVLCDVMCSGDGTLRKNPDLWRTWVPQRGNSLHKLQVNIARRSLQLLAVDGLMVYSTCTFNPVEDEAVVAELLRYGKGAVELVDVSQQLPSLKRSPGVSSWKVIDKDMVVFNSLEEVPQNARSYFVPSFFPPTEEEAKEFHLDRSFRILPHLQNTGGFFVAVLRKTKELQERNTTVPRPPPAKKQKAFKEDPFVFLEEGDPRWKEIADHYGVSDSFPYRNLLGRTVEADRKRTLYFVNDAVKNFLECNQEKVKVINAGIKMFGRVESKFELCRFRMSQDGVSTIFPFLEKRVVAIDVEDMCKLLKTDNGTENYPREKLKCDESLRGLGSGSVILTTERDGYSVVICAWMGEKSVAPYISKEERVHVLRMLGEDTTEIELKIWSSRQMKAVRGREGAAKRNADENGANDTSDAVKEEPDAAADLDLDEEKEL